MGFNKCLTRTVDNGLTPSTQISSCFHFPRTVSWPTSFRCIPSSSQHCGPSIATNYPSLMRPSCCVSPRRLPRCSPLALLSVDFLYYFYFPPKGRPVTEPRHHPSWNSASVHLAWVSRYPSIFQPCLHRRRVMREFDFSRLARGHDLRGRVEYSL